MDYEEIVRETLAYVEEHLDESVSLVDVAERVHVSPYHFHRLFSAHIGEPLMAYVRRRRLLRAAAELSAPGRSIQEIALDCQFSSQSTFTRAFHEAYGISPGRYRREGRRPDSGSPFEFRGREAIRLARIVDGPSFTFVGPALKGLETGEPNSPRIVALWQQFNARRRELTRLAPQMSYGVCIPGKGSRFDYMAAYAVDAAADVPQGMEQVHVPPQRYAAFEHVGPPDGIADTYARIFSTGLTQEGVQYREGAPDMEVYTENPDSNRGVLDDSIEIWIPIL